jgi:hypothetical protein
MEQIAPKTGEIGGIWIGTELVRVQVSRMKIDDDRRVPAVREKKSKEKGKKGSGAAGPAGACWARRSLVLAAACTGLDAPKGRLAGPDSVRSARFFFCFSIFVFLFSYFFHNFCILASNELKPLSKFF